MPTKPIKHLNHFINFNAISQHTQCGIHVMASHKNAVPVEEVTCLSCLRGLYLEAGKDIASAQRDLDASKCESEKIYKLITAVRKDRIPY